MAGWLKVVLGLVVVGALGGVWMLLDGGGGAEPADEPAGLSGLGGEGDDGLAMDDLTAGGRGDRGGRVEPLAAQPEALDVADGASLASEAAEVDEQPRPRVRVLGRLADGAGRPVADARVVAHVAGALDMVRRFADSDQDMPARPETTSGPDGRFALEFPLPAEDTEERDGFLRRMLGDGARLAAVHEAYAVHVEEGIELVEGDVDIGTLILHPGGGVLGRVVDGRGRPVEGADVVGRAVADPRGGPGFMFSMFNTSVQETYTRATTGRDGRFLITGLEVGDIEVTAEADGKQMAYVDGLELSQGQALDVGDVVLEDGGAIAGYVYDDQGAPLEGASIRVSSMSRIVLNSAADLPRRDIGREMRLRAETDENGWFELSGLGTGHYTVHVSADGFTRSSTDNVLSGTLDFEARLALLGTLEVLVLSARDGQPVLEAELTARNQERFGRGQELTIVPAERPGRWLVEGAGDQGTEITVRADGYATLVHEGPAVEPGGHGETQVELVAESVLAGRVVDADGEGLPGASVSVREWVEPADPFSGGAVTIERNVRRSFGGGDGPEWQRARTDAEGDFTIRGVPAGEWEVLASADGHVRSEPVHVSLDVGGEQRDLRLRLATAGVLTGLVVDDQGAPIEGASVRVTPQANAAPDDDPTAALLRGLSLGGGGDDPSAPRAATTDDDGRFRMDGLAEGRVLAQLTKSQGGMGFGGAMVFFGGMGGGDTIDHPDAQAAATIVAGEEAFVRLVRPPMADLEGRVLADGVGVPDVTVNLKEARSFLPFGGQTAKTDRLGNYRFEGVQPGDYSVSSMIPGAGLEESIDVDLRAGQLEHADLVFDGQTLSGRVVNAQGGEGVAGLSLEVKAQSDAVSEGLQGGTRMAFSFVSAGSGGGSTGMTVDMGGQGSRLQTDDQGRFEARWLKPGNYTVVVSGGGFMETESELIELEEGVDVDGLVIEVARGAVLHGIVSDRNSGKALEGVPVTLRAADGGPEMQMTEPGGGYRFEGLEPGAYSVTVMGSGFGSEPSAAADVDLDAGEVRNLDLQSGGT